MKRPAGIPASMVVPPTTEAPARPSWKNASLGPVVVAPRPSPAIQAPSPAAVPQVPMWREQVEQRKHILEFDLEEVRLHRESPDLVPGWHQSTTYKVLLLPFSDDDSLPFVVPKYTQQGEFLVSKSVAAREPTAKNHGMKHIPFKEKLVLHTDYPIPNCQAVLWGSVGNVAHEEVVLLGKTVISLFDYSMQRKLIPWHVIDANEDVTVADMFMKYEVKTTPAAVQLLHLTDVKRDRVALHWSAPLNDHGSPVQGYRIDILKPQTQTGAQWHTLCECTPPRVNFYVIPDLEGNTEYQVNVMAVNSVGAGDPCEFQIQTAPIEPTAPAKPWIQEARDGCLCVAWHASTSDGGSAITTYKVQMRKLKGVSGPGFLSMFGPSDKDAAWADIGSVGAVMDELKDQPSVYAVWAGPLDDGRCEYRFRVFSMNSAGVSDASELTDAHYT